MFFLTMEMDAEVFPVALLSTFYNCSCREATTGNMPEFVGYIYWYM